MTNLRCGDVRVIDGVPFVPLMLDGQSFLFNQIRHMVAMSVTFAAAVCSCSELYVRRCWHIDLVAITQR